MNWLPAFAAWHFAVAGFVCASLPVVIHLLNRRRFRVVQWAAMDFLREALQRNRRVLELRDLLLLLLRTAAVLLFGLALARPYFSARNEAFDGSQPLHAVLLVDNSLSMGYQSLQGASLDAAKERARELIDKLPRGSRISVVPVCGSEQPLSLDPYDTAEGALEALERIETVDRAGGLQRAINEARRAVAAAPELAPRVVFFGDMQRGDWSDLSDDGRAFEGLPSVQVVDVGPESWENAWISDLRLQDGLADVETPTTIVVELQRRGGEPRRDVEVKLSVEGREVAAKTVSLSSGEGPQQVAFEYVFHQVQPEPGRQQFVAISASLPPDSLPADDQRHLLAPVVAALPVVFIDQFSAEQEDPLQHRFGETRQLRKLLAPLADRNQSNRNLVQIRRLTIDEVSPETLADARLAVVAGVTEPSAEAVRVLREYVQQGGRLFLAAGAEFDPRAWQAAAWLDGAGVLPAPLKPQPIGALPEEAGDRLRPFSISFESLAADAAFQLPEMSQDDLRDLYGEPFFFKAVEADVGEELLATLRTSERARLTELRTLEAELARDAAPQAAGDGAIVEDAARRERLARLRQLQPSWLRWSREADDDRLDDPATPAAGSATGDGESAARTDDDARRLDALVERSLPRVLARFSSEQGPAFLVERRIGEGRVVLATSGMLSSWNTLPKTNTMFLLDRLLRGMIHETLPERNYAERPRIVVPLPAADGLVSASLLRPGRNAPGESLDVGFIGRERRGVVISHPLSRGFYRVEVRSEDERTATPADPAASPDGSAAGATSGGPDGPPVDGAATASAEPADASAASPASAPGSAIVLAMNGPADESDLSRLPRERFDELAASAPVHWIGRGEEISLAGAQIHGQDSWWYLAAAVLLLLLGELALLAWPAWRAGRTAPTPAAG